MGFAVLCTQGTLSKLKMATSMKVEQSTDLFTCIFWDEGVVSRAGRYGNWISGVLAFFAPSYRGDISIAANKRLKHPLWMIYWGFFSLFSFLSHKLFMKMMSAIFTSISSWWHSISTGLGKPSWVFSVKHLTGIFCRWVCTNSDVVHLPFFICELIWLQWLCSGITGQSNRNSVQPVQKQQKHTGSYG